MPPKRATKVAAAPSGNVATGTNKSIEEKYQSMTQEEHILARPDTYVGDIQPQTEPLFVFEDETNQIIKKPITYVPGLYKIFDEILVNASDQKQIDPSMDCIMVEVDKQSNQISVYNNGKGIDVELHSEHGIYVPELIFGKLLTSTNYDDTEQRTTGGRNGYGAKLTNIFSQKFIVETVDFARKRKFTQEFTENMTQRTKPIVENLKVCKNGYTKITFIPDFVRFKQTGLTNDMISLIKKGTYD
jgi:DNA topoisomerase-2